MASVTRGQETGEEAAGGEARETIRISSERPVKAYLPNARHRGLEEDHGAR